jgi:hypothetical protein
MSVRVELPFHLRKLADVEREVNVDVAMPVTQRAIIDAIEARYPMLRGTIRDYATDRMCRCQTPSRRAPSRS